jgi:ankyrin repeat protein
MTPACMHASHAPPTHTHNCKQGWTPLHSAVSSGREKVVATLLELGVELDATNSGGQTPLHYAVSGQQQQQQQQALTAVAHAHPIHTQH